MRIILFVLVLTCVSCASDGDTDSKRQYWSKEIASLNSKRPTRSYVLKTYAAYVVPKQENENELTLIDTIEVNNLVCIDWHFIISIAFEESETLKSATLKETGTCL